MPLPLQVDVGRDWLDYLNTFGTLIAAALAAFAVFQASRSSRKALEAIRRERRLDFDMERLIELQDALTKGNIYTHGRVPAIQMSLNLLPETDLPLVRECFMPGANGQPLIGALGVEQQPGQTLEESTASDQRRLKDHMIDAVNSAIQKRLDERGR